MARQRFFDYSVKTFEIHFPFNHTVIILNVNPEEYAGSAPHRQDVVQTLTGVVVDAFGAGVGTGSISGTCGWGRPLAPAPGSDYLSGLEQFASLKRTYQQWQDFQVQAADPALVTCEIANVIDDEHYDVVFTNLEWRHSISRPFLIQYTLTWRILKDYSAPVRRSALVQIGGSGAAASADAPDWPDLPRRL